jgi:hypothetical protein
MTDDQKHKYARLTTGFDALFLPPALYKIVEEQGYDMRAFVVAKPIPQSLDRAQIRPIPTPAR